MLLPINLGRVFRPFPNSLKSIILQQEGLFRSGRQLRELPVFPGVDVPANSDHGMFRETAKKRKQNRDASQTLQASVGMLKFKVLNRVIILACFTATGQEHLAVTESP